MRHFSAVIALSLGGQLFSERKISSRSACRALAFELVCLLSLIGSAAYGQAPVGDAFNESTLNTSLWAVKAPVSGSAALSGGQLVITVPGGSNHQAYTPLNAVRVIQAVSNANFDVYVKINSQLTPSAQDSFAGLLVGGDGSNWIYYYAYTDGSNVDLLCASVDAGVQNIRLNTIPFAGYPVPAYLRLQRAGTTYTAYWSADAVSWTSAGSFNDSLVVTHLGPFAGNNNSNPANAPAVSAAFGGFENTPSESTVATPTFTPASGTSFSSTLSVTIADSTPSSTIHYTTDGSTPTTSSTIYSGAITLAASATVKAIATASGFTQSAVGSASYTLMTAAGAPVSDEFNESSLNTGLWTVRAPVGGTAAVSNGELVITVPAGSNHDAFVPALDAVQVVQPVSNTDFDVAVKIDSTLLASALYTGQGIMVEGDAKDYIRFEVAATGSITLIAATIESGTQSTTLQVSPFSGYPVPTYLQLQRVGTTYTAYWSADGVNWNNVGSFTDSLVVTGLAPYAWNYNATPSKAPAITAKFDWFHNLSTTAAVPTFTPASGTSFSSPLSVAIADATPGVTVYYTSDGSIPTTSSQAYSGPITLDATTVVNAIAAGNGYTQSEVGSATYTYKPVTNGPSFSLSVAPASFALSPGLSQTLTISAEPVNGFTGTVSVSLVNLPAGISVSPGSLSLAPGSAQQLTFSASSSFTSSGTATLNATSGSLEQSQLIAFSPLPLAPSSPVSSGLMAYFPMGEGTGSTIHDVSSNAYSGTFGGSGDSWQPGGVSLNGQGWIDLPEALNSAQTIQMWINFPSTNPTSAQVLVGGSGSCCSGNTDWQIQPLQTGDSMQQIAGFSYGATSSLSSEPFLGSGTLTFAMGSSSQSTTDQFWINGNQVAYQQGPANAVGFATGASAGSQTSGHYQVGAAASALRLSGTVGPIAFYNRRLTSSEIAANAAYFNQLQQSRGVETQLGNAVTQNQFVGMGDSITFGYPLPGGPYCQYLAFNAAYNSQCLGIIGQTSSFGLSEAAQFAQYYAEAAPKNVLLVWFGTNDVTNGTPVSQIFANLLSTCQTIKQVYPGWRVLLATMLSRSYNGLDYDPYKNSLNTLIRENATQQCDGFIDMAADPNLGADGAYGDSYFYDETHPTQAGYEQVAAMTSSYINSLDGYTITNPDSQSSVNYKMTSADNYINANVNGTGSWTLPECQGLTGKSYQITNKGSGVLTVSGTNSESISGSDEVEPGATATLQINLISPSAAGCNWTRTQ
jgi:lysophospholipase L1-like esterase